MEVAFEKMHSAVATKAEVGLLPLPSLRLLAPPLHLLSASMWQILKKKHVTCFWKVSEFVLFVMETVPELLLFKHWTQLILGLRARFILELCRTGEDQQLIKSYLENMKTQQLTLHKELPEEERAWDDFNDLIHSLLEHNQERQVIFQEIWCEEYGCQFDSDLEMLCWEFFCRLNQLLPVPELEQTVLWLGESSPLEGFLQCISELTHMKNLLLHHKQLGHLEEHVPPSSMGDHILYSLSDASQNRPSKLESNPQPGLKEDIQPTLFVEDAPMELLTVTGCAEIELTASATDIQVVVIDNPTPFNPIEEETVIVLPEDVVNYVKESSTMEKENKPSTTLEDESHVAASAEVEVFIDHTSSNDAIAEETVITLNENTGKDVEEHDAMEENSVSPILKYKPLDRKGTVRPHDCPDCHKKFKFASFLVAHRVIHTGERPHKCSECGQCFSFRQSLERHRHTHKTAKSFLCPICHEHFPSSAARSVHKQTHNKDGDFDYQQESKKFTQELHLTRNIKTHSDVNGNEEIVQINREQEAVLTQVNNVEKASEAYDEEQSKMANCEFKTSENQVIDAQFMNKVISLVQVRTSQRKRKATMKMKNLQKKIKRQKEAGKVKDRGLKPVQPINSSDHSYGTSTTPSKQIYKGAITKGASYSCPHCGYCHSEEEQIQQHIIESHSDRPDAEKRQTPKAEAEENDGQKTRGSLKCSFCEELFKSFKDRKAHTSGTHMRNGVYFCNRCGKNYTWRAAFRRHIKMYCSVGGTSSFACPHCELVFDSASYLYRHSQTHQEEKVHVCNCGKRFAYKAALTAHERTHQKERPHVCHQCGKGFLYKGGLRGHMKIHSEDTPFTCSHCGKGFKRERSMKKHERCHTREDVFKCSQCDKSFVYKATLTRHELTHTGERPYLCSDCGKGFFSHAELLKHERFHTGHKPFECPHCGKKFTQSCYLTIHLRYHTGAKPYTCSECEKSFLSANRLKRHQRTHTGEKPYVCEECGKGFRQSYHLTLHQRTHVIDLTYEEKYTDGTP